MQGQKDNNKKLFRTSPPSLGRDTLGLGTPGRLWGWALRGHSGVGHSMGTPGHSGLGLGSGAGHSAHSEVGQRQGDSGVGHSRETLDSRGTVELGRDTLGLGTPGMREE